MSRAFRFGLFALPLSLFAIACAASSTDSDGSAAAAVSDANRAACKVANPSNVDMKACEEFHFQRADRALNKVYSELKPNLDPKGMSLLVTAQRLWAGSGNFDKPETLGFRDLICQAEAHASACDDDGENCGTNYGLALEGCRTAYTRMRVADLMRFDADVTGREVKGKPHFKIECDGSSTVEQGKCAEDAYLSEDAKLNAVYKQVTPLVRGKNLQELKAAQNTWVKFRDAVCDAESHALFCSDGDCGTGYGPQLNTCLASYTHDRTAQLRTLLETLSDN